MGGYNSFVASMIVVALVLPLGFVSASFSTFSIVSKVCGYDKLELLEQPDGNYMSINGRKIDDSFFICEALESYVSHGCFIGDPKLESWSRMREQHCGREFNVFGHSENSYSVNLFKQVGRKLLLQLPVNSSSGDEAKKRGQLEGDAPFSDAQDVPFALPGILLLCCGVLCPCFHAKRREENEEDLQTAQLPSMDSISSVDMSTHSEKISAAPTPRVPPSPSRFSLSPQLSRIGSLHLNMSQVIKATQNFSPAQKLGEGGFGYVYKGVLPDGQVVAIKRAKKEHISALRDEFSNEVELLAKIEHRNLVRLLGYLEKGSERIIITEFVPNGTLREHLDGQHGKILDFNQRLEVAIDVAHALTYLHLYSEKIIIHRDVKSSNILLTESYRAKVSDFGFARSGPTDADQTHISTKVKGTAGYLDPEYLRTYQLTTKSDVFSFGILLIEIISGRRPVDLKRNADERITVRWAFRKHSEGNLMDVVDPLLEEKVDEDVVGKMLELAFHCAAPTRNDRPDMKEVGEHLWEIRKEYGKSLRKT